MAKEVENEIEKCFVEELATFLERYNACIFPDGEGFISIDGLGFNLSDLHGEINARSLRELEE